MTIDEVWEILKCCLSASKRTLSHEQIEFLMQRPIRAAYFERVMA